MDAIAPSPTPAATAQQRVEVHRRPLLCSVTDTVARGIGLAIPEILKMPHSPIRVCGCNSGRAPARSTVFFDDLFIEKLMQHGTVVQVGWLSLGLDACFSS